MVVVLLVVAVVVVAALVFLSLPRFGALPRGARLARILRSKNYDGGEFRNQEPTAMFTGERNIVEALVAFLFTKRERLRPDAPLDVVRTVSSALPKTGDYLVWYGHSSLLLSLVGRTVVVDPVFYDASPVSFVNRAFRGPDVFRPADLPARIDVLLITHNHWDHLDYRTAVELRGRVGVVVAPLGVGAHFERWGYSAEQIVELDWEEDYSVASGMVVHCLPSRHFSGRGLRRNKTLWASYVVEGGGRRVFLSGDGGYDGRFRRIGERFPGLDLAVMENGQYDADWAQIHTLPSELAREVEELAPRRVLTIHHSKYALANHAWDEPMANVEALSSAVGAEVVTLRLGEAWRL